MIKKKTNKSVIFGKLKKVQKPRKLNFLDNFYDYFFVTLPTGKYQYNVKTLIYRYLYNPYN